MGAVTEMRDQQAPAADAVLESHTHQDAPPAASRKAKSAANAVRATATAATGASASRATKLLPRPAMAAAGEAKEAAPEERMSGHATRPAS